MVNMTYAMFTMFTASIFFFGLYFGAIAHSFFRRREEVNIRLRRLGDQSRDTLYDWD